MTLDEKKYQRQVAIVDKWLKDTGGVGCLEACTGFGKTFTALIAIKRFRKKYSDPVIVVVPSVPLKEQWERQVVGLDVEVFVINTYINHTHECVLLILDEVHRYASDEFHKVFELTSYKFLLGLTGTLERLDGKHSLIEEKAPVFERVTIEEARREGYVSEFKIYNLGLELNEEDSKAYEKIHSTLDTTFAYFLKDFNLAMECAKGVSKITTYGITAAELRTKFAYEQGWDGRDEDHYRSPKNIQLKALHWLKSMQQRKAFIYTANSKIEAIAEIAKQFPKDRMIIFGENTDFADRVVEKLGNEAVAYHTNLKSVTETVRTEKISKTGKVSVTYKVVKKGPTKRKTENLKAFLNKEKRILVTSRAADEGLDDDSISFAIQSSYSSGKRQDTQRTGRAIRVDYNNKDKKSVIINLYIKGTQEVAWLKEKQRGKKGIIFIDSVKELLTQETLILN